MSANTPSRRPVRRPLHEKTGGGLIWTAGFLCLLTLLVRVMGTPPAAVVSLHSAMGEEIQAETL